MNTSSPSVGFISLGCPKALVDSERILTQLSTDGYRIVNNYDDANVVIVNTCGFIDEAVAESLNTIGEALDANGRVIVTGCLGVKPEMIRELHPGVLAISGPQAYESVMQAVHQAVPKPAKNPHIDLVPDIGLRLTPRHYAYLKISEGCDHKCSFCIIPSMRGRLQSRSAGDVMREAEALAKSGVKELLVVSQDTSAYGADIKHKLDFWGGKPVKSRLFELCKALGELDVWVRLHYVYPYPNVDELIPLMAEGKILPYLDIPLQHANSEILKAMRRPGNIERTLERIRSWREICPDIAIRSTFITGFPGETEAQFQELLDFIDEAEINRAGCFAYSPVEGAGANALPDAVSEEVKQERLARFMQKHDEVSRRLLEAKIGSVMPVLIDEIDEDSQSAIARSPYDAPEIDGVVHISHIEGAEKGQLLHVEIHDADEHDLFAEVY